MITIEQCRAARALLDWSAEILAKSAGVGVATVRRYESGMSVAAGSLSAIEDAFSAAGVTFIDAGEASPAGGQGVRFDPT
ncbi:multiprotein-bridging factor 1 family protein [Sphingomonas qilianensis]|uniref:Helix-turn-helix transcriptional regulator n=1 Tax=Sphingomonas qilianensis TaxID=1736690 RepID=A0ABU9XWQ0_9SPHN